MTDDAAAPYDAFIQSVLDAAAVVHVTLTRQDAAFIAGHLIGTLARQFRLEPREPLIHVRVPVSEDDPW